MLFPETRDPERKSAIKIAIIISVILGICGAIGIIVFEIQAERYSSVYINPESYSNYLSDKPVSFIYGIHSYEKQSTDYTIVILAGSSVLETKTVTLMPGEVYEEKKIVQIPDGLEFPVKISVQTSSPYETNDVHFWVKNSSVSG